MLADVYDMWRTDYDLWDDAYRLNDLFWHYNFWGFEKKFADGFFGFTEDELSHCSQIKQRRIDAIESAPKSMVENTGIILLPDREAINEVTLYFDDVENFFILYRGDFSYSISIRSKSDGVNVNDALRSCVGDILVGGGGHKLAGGGMFAPDLKINTIIEFCENVLHPALKESKND
jgi:hypothetical protein